MKGEFLKLGDIKFRIYVDENDLIERKYVVEEVESGENFWSDGKKGRVKMIK